jgi:hypothetical protein
VEENISPSDRLELEASEYVESPKEVEEACLYESGMVFIFDNAMAPVTPFMRMHVVQHLEWLCNRICGAGSFLAIMERIQAILEERGLLLGLWPEKCKAELPFLSDHGNLP